MSASHRSVLVELRDDFARVRKLVDEDSKKDPISEPYRSKYAASVVLTDMKSKLSKILDEASANEKPRFKAMLGLVWLHLGTISVDTEEFSTGEEQLLNCLSILSKDVQKRDSILALLSALNQLGILWSQRDQPTKSKEYLERAEKLYQDFVSNNSSDCLTLHSLFQIDDDSEDELLDTEHTLEKTHTLTLYYLAQIYSSLNDHLKAAVYCHTTLKRQLEFKDFDPVDWAVNSATLSQYFMEKNGFKQARHHLAAASFILDQYKDMESTEGSTADSLEAKRERFAHRSADVARCWAKYGLLLLAGSRDRLLRSADTDTDEGPPAAPGQDLRDAVMGSGVSQDEVNELWFTSLELSSYEEQITDSHVLTFEEAREVFLKTQAWLTTAMEYYSLDGFASDYVQIVQDHSQLFKVLAFFEEDEDRQSRMHKRRVDLLEGVLRELSAQHYLLLCRQLWFELAEVCSDILDIKLQKLQGSDERPSLHAIRKVNHLTTQSITYFTKFLDSLRNRSTGEMPSSLSEDVERPALIAYFRIGRLHSKIISSDKAVQADSIRSSLDAFSFVAQYCARHKAAREQLRLEAAVCEDMAKLLPLKLQRLQRELQEH
ncbi:KIF-binding protein [Bacillus rossius redtenbacheri]|uniref:KIF-binding protein n=1 Tax=Bacillus rossius redtenbacheri TaxID=93214 RepID=UPI002FDE8B89